MFEYKSNLVKVVDGDTVDVDIDLGFGVVLADERIRLIGIDTPESRTSDPVEKLFGNAAKHKVQEILQNELKGDLTLLSKDFKGKFGRILGDFKLTGYKNETLTELLLAESFGVPYSGKSKELVKEAHLLNREVLLEAGIVDVEQYNSLEKEVKDVV